MTNSATFGTMEVKLQDITSATLFVNGTVIFLNLYCLCQVFEIRRLLLFRNNNIFRKVLETVDTYSMFYATLQLVDHTKQRVNICVFQRIRQTSELGKYAILLLHKDW